VNKVLEKNTDECGPFANNLININTTIPSNDLECTLANSKRLPHVDSVVFFNTLDIYGLRSIIHLYLIHRSHKAMHVSFQAIPKVLVVHSHLLRF
jgi:hypothetical protein